MDADGGMEKEDAWSHLVRKSNKGLSLILKPDSLS